MKTVQKKQTQRKNNQRKRAAQAVLTEEEKERLRRRRRRRQIQRRKRLQRRRRILGVLLLLLLAVGGLGLQKGLQKGQKPQSLISEACEAYRPKVEEFAAKYQMTDYVDLILAVMMQESSGRGTDVMQSAEGAYNTQYPKVPGGIQDPEYSIECGIQELKYAMEQAEVRNKKDMGRIEMALQGYNFGADSYFSYMKEQGQDAWSEETAQDFAKIASGGTARSQDDPYRETAGPWDYGDQLYPVHVLRYYPHGQ